jgi:hypothetical protein
MNSVDLKWLCFLHIWKEMKEGRKEGSEGGEGRRGQDLPSFQVPSSQVDKKTLVHNSFIRWRLPIFF